jgi:flagellar export protein FliJ
VTAELKGLIRVAKAAVDDRQRALARLLQQVDDLVGQRLRIEQDLARERKIAREGQHGEGIHFARYAVSAISRCRQLQEAAAAVEADINAEREALGEAYRHLRALELADESRKRRHAEARARRERDELDELGLQRHQRAALP